MRVLVFSTDDHLYPAGGAEQAFGNISERLPHIEFDLVCAKLRKGVSRYEEVKNVRMYRMGFGIPKIDGFILALFGHYCAEKLMKKHTYDMVWSIMASYGGFAAARVSRKHNIPFLLTLQEGDSLRDIERRVRFVKKSFRNIFAQASTLQAISRYLLTWGVEMGYAGTLGKVIPNGVDISAFTKPFSEDVVRATRASFGFVEDATILFTSSRLEKKNGIMDVVEALPYLPPQVCFVVCGSGSLERSIRARVEELNLSKRVKFMGFVDPSELPLLMRASDVFIRPSLSEGLGTAFLEAMAAGLLVVGTHEGGIPDFLTDGQTGFVVHTEDARHISEVLQRILSLSEIEKSVIRERAVNMVKEKYAWETVSEQMETLFKETIACTR